MLKLLMLIPQHILRPTQAVSLLGGQLFPLDLAVDDESAALSERREESKVAGTFFWLLFHLENCQQFRDKAEKLGTHRLTSGVPG
jgi:hypothetical protein